ncbi:MAG: PEP-utilizing enzyme [Patescibacteria group bacterium]
MLDRLINSQTRLAILNLFFQDPAKKYYSREIVKLLKLDPANVHKELANLVAGNFLLTEIAAGKKYFLINRQNPFFGGLQEIFSRYQAKSAIPQLICVEEMPNYYPMMVTLAWNTYWANGLFARFGIKRRFSCLLSIYQDNLCQLLVPKQGFTAIGEEILSLVVNDPAWGDRYIRELKEQEGKLYRVSEELKKLNLKKFSDRDLFKVYADYYEIYSQLHVFHWIQTGLDFDENVFSKYLMAYLKKQIVGTAYSLGDAFSVLTTPLAEAKPAEEYRDLLLIYQSICQEAKLKKYFADTETRLIVSELPERQLKLWHTIQRHAADFGFLGYNTAGPAWDAAYFIDILSSLVRQAAKPEVLLAEIAANKQNTQAKQRQLEKDLRLDENHLRIFHFARDLIFSKGTRKDSMFYSYSIIENLWREIGRRHYLSVRQVRYLHPHEVKKLLVEHKFDTAILNERYKFSLNFSVGRYEEDKNLTGQAAKDFIATLDIIQEDISNVKILYGDCASPGRVRGEVKIINEPKDMAKMNKGDILVSYATTPDLVPAIKKAAAIVTDAGGITCHAAIISRELGVPCVVGTKIATKVLHDGDIIDVNATHGKVDIIKKG